MRCRVTGWENSAVGKERSGMGNAKNLAYEGGQVMGLSGLTMIRCGVAVLLLWRRGARRSGTVIFVPVQNLCLVTSQQTEHSRLHP